MVDISAMCRCSCHHNGRLSDKPQSTVQRIQQYHNNTIYYNYHRTYDNYNNILYNHDLNSSNYYYNYLHNSRYDGHHSTPTDHIYNSYDFSPHSNTQTKFDSHLITAPLIAQTPNYPSGCESVSAVMLLNYWGESITVDTFIDDYLPKSTKYYTKSGVFYGPSPYEYFIGNPRTTNAYGCMAPAIKKAIDQYYGTDSPAKNVTGYTLKELCSQFIDNDQPVLVWVTIGMVETQPGDSWHFEDGTLFSWPVNEHCMMLVGYDKNYYYFNDPYTGKLKKYAHWICEDRYNTLGQQALTIIK